MAREYFCAYHSYLQPIQDLSDAECGRLFKALLRYSAGEEPIKLDGRESIAYAFIKAQIDRDTEAYEAKVKALSENGAKGGRPKSKQKQKNQMVFSESKKSQGKGKGKGEGEEKEEEKENNYYHSSLDGASKGARAYKNRGLTMEEKLQVFKELRDEFQEADQ